MKKIIALVLALVLCKQKVEEALDKLSEEQV